MDSSQNGIEPGAIEVEAEPGSALVGEVVEPSSARATRAGRAKL